MSTGTEGTAPTNRFAPPTAEVADVAVAGTELAGRGMRLLAVLIDGLIQGAIYWILTIVAFSALDPRKGSIGVGVIAGQVVLGFGLFILIQGYLLHTEGQTVGKKLLGMRIVRSNGERATLGRLLGLRYLVGWVIVMIPFIGAIYALVDCLMIFRDSRKCVHDNIADTIVVKV
ncbi:MAG TPA: RDD family protein [Burkholderiaceae bacterium]|nr:RDD family protein [Burkholderiaceae bacterium]